MFVKLCFEEKRNEMEREKQITPCYSSLEEARRKWVFANICIFLMMGGTLMIKSVGWEQRTGSAEQTLQLLCEEPCVSAIFFYFIGTDFRS